MLESFYYKSKLEVKLNINFFDPMQKLPKVVLA